MLVISFQLSVFVIIACIALKTPCAADEARTLIEDNVSRAKQEAVPHTPEGHSSDGPIVLPLYSGNKGSLASGSGDHGSPSSSNGHSKSDSDHSKGSEEHERFQVATVDFHHVSSPYIISLWIIIAGLAKIGFHVTPKLHIICPESCVLLLIGVMIGLLLFFTGLSSVGPLTPDVFFLYMLPPIVLDAGYFMPNRLFFDNLVTILLYAVIGTVWNAITIGLSLWAIGLTGLYQRSVPLLDTLLFSSIISAVDPVAVLAVFEDIHVNEVLYIIVFGESLLNDAVTVVLYHMFEGYTKMGLPNILPVDYVAGVASFFVVALGGTFVGIIWGIVAAFISRFTHHVRVIEPLFIFVMAYLSYLTAELFHLSGIMALTFCGITMKNYIEENISHKSHVTVKYTMKMLANSSETIIFVVLGVSTVNDKHEWNTWFVVLTIIFCSVYRALGVVILTALANRFRLHQFDKVEQFIMSYGGLRGAVAFALVLIIDENIIPSKNMMVTTVISVVYFTVFVQGMTIGFFVNILKVAKSNKARISMNERFHATVIDHLMAGIEGISDHLLGNYKIRDKFKYYNNKFIRPFLTRNPKVQEPKILETHSKLNLTDAVNLVKQNGNLLPVMNTDTGVSLSTMFKSYTQANLCRLAPDEAHPPLGNPSFLNVDMSELSYNPSFKDLADAEIHHILEDAMFKPAKRSRRYSRSEIYEPAPKHPPFHHHMRMQIRRLMSESSKRQNPKPGNLTLNGCPRTGAGEIGAHKSSPISTIYLNADSKHPQLCVTRATDDNFNLPNSLPEEEDNELDDDEGIIFTAKKKFSVVDDKESSPSSRTVTETSLPWKRNEEKVESECVRPQQEFPAWVDNKDYYMGYLSPTNTFLEGLSTASTPCRRPSVFEIFSPVETIPESNDENEDGAEYSGYTPHDVSPPKSAPLPSTKDQFPKTPSTTSQEFYKVPPGRRTSTGEDTPTSRGVKGKKPSLTRYVQSPDKFSVTTISSQGFRRSSNDTARSIEGPDIALDIDSEDSGTDTKL